MTAESEKLLDDVVARFADVKGASAKEKSVADLAKTDLFEIRNLAIGKVAPEVAGEDQDCKPIKLSDYRGKVVVLDFWGYW